MRFIILSAILAACCALQTCHAARFFVSPDGDDNNPGTRSAPFRTFRFACLNLNPGDTLLVARAEFPNEGNVLLRRVEPETLAFLPLNGSASSRTNIIPWGPGTEPPRIFGSLDIRGSFITVRGLELIGDDEGTDNGISVLESHDVRIQDCIVTNHGGNGISFTHSDMVSAVGNVVSFNATRSPIQGSGISSFQPIVRTDSDASFGLIIARNICISNENIVPPSDGADVTDGNGIIVDDHLYVQNSAVVNSILSGTVDPIFTSGTPRIETDGNGQLLGYQRRSLISRNLCRANGGRGIHVFQSDNLLIGENSLSGNLTSADLTTGLPRDPITDKPFFVAGQLSIVDSKEVVAIRNVATASGSFQAGAVELFFNRVPESGQSPNRFFRNAFINPEDRPRDAFAFGLEESDLMPTEILPGFAGIPGGL